MSVLKLTPSPVGAAGDEPDHSEISMDDPCPSVLQFQWKMRPHEAWSPWS